MGNFAWLVPVLGLGLLVVSEVAQAQVPATGSFPPSAPATNAAAPVAPGATATVLPAPPPAPSTAPPASSPAPAPIGAPPAGYAYPAYPPQGYGYYYPPQMPRAQARFPEHAAVDSSPFIDVLAASVSWENRISEIMNVGVQAGVYLAGRVRLSAKLLLPSSSLTDQYYAYDSYYPTSSSSTYYTHDASKAASLFYGASLGLVVVDTRNFVMAPGVGFSRSDVSDYGSSLGLSLPFEWVTASGVRIGLGLDFGRAFGGSYRLKCASSSSTCSSGLEITQDRPTGTSVAVQFEFGFGFNHPAPLPSEPLPNSAPYGYPAPAPFAVPAGSGPPVAPPAPAPPR